MQREFNHGNNGDGHFRFLRVESSAGEWRFSKKLARNVKDVTSKNKNYSCWKIKISEAIENYRFVAFIYLFDFFLFKVFYLYIFQYVRLKIRTLKKIIPLTSKILTIIYSNNGQISNCHKCNKCFFKKKVK